MRGLVFVLPLALAACHNIDGAAQSWRGRSMDDLIAAWGPPMNDSRLSDGRRAISYSGPSGPFGNYVCQVSFVADPAGRIISASMQQNAPMTCASTMGNKPSAR